MNYIIETLKKFRELSEDASEAPWQGGPVESIGGGNLYDQTVVIAHFQWDNECDRTPIHRFRTAEECNANLAFVSAARNIFTPSFLDALMGCVTACEGASGYWVDCKSALTNLEIAMK